MEQGLLDYALDIAGRESFENAIELNEARIVESALVMSCQLFANVAFVDFVTSRGADFNFVVHQQYADRGITSRRIAALCMHKGLLIYPLDSRVRMSVAMTIPDAQLAEGYAILREALDEIGNYGEIGGGELEHA